MRRIGLLVAIVILVGGVVLFNYLMGQSSFVAEKLPDLNNLQQKQVDVFLQMTSLVGGFATLALGGIGALIWERKKSRKSPTPQLLTAAAGSALSLYFGYLCFRNLLWMLNHHFLDLNNQSVAWTSFLQFASFFTSIIALSDYVFVG